MWLYHVTTLCPKLTQFYWKIKLHRPESSKIFTRMGIKSDFEVTVFTTVNSVDSAILCQIHVIKKSVYHTGNNYRFYSNGNYIYYHT